MKTDIEHQICSRWEFDEASKPQNQKLFPFSVHTNGGDWRSKSLTLLLNFSTTLDGFYFANCVLAAVFFIFDYQYFRK